MTPEERGHPFVAAVLDLAMRSMEGVRERIVPEARGRVLEIGLGTGLNLPYYRVFSHFVGVEPDPFMRKRAAARAAALGMRLDIVEARAEALPLADESFDTVVMTWTLCSVDEPPRVLSEIRRVLRPGGTLLFAEHTRSRFPLAERLQDGLTPAWARVAGGCHMNRDALRLVREAGFFDVETHAFGRERFTLFPIYGGRASR